MYFLTTTPADSLSHILWNKYCRQLLTYLSIYLLCSCCYCCQPPKQFNHVTYLKCLSLLRNSSECYKPNYERTNKYTYSYSHPSAHNLWFIAILCSEIPVYYYLADFLKKLLFKCLLPNSQLFHVALLCSALLFLPSIPRTIYRPIRLSDSDIFVSSWCVAVIDNLRLN